MEFLALACGGSLDPAVEDEGDDHEEAEEDELDAETGDDDGFSHVTLFRCLS